MPNEYAEAFFDIRLLPASSFGVSIRLTVTVTIGDCQCDFYLRQTALERSHLVFSRFSTSDSLRVFSSTRDQSDRSDFILIKTCDETGRYATPICLLFLHS